MEQDNNNLENVQNNLSGNENTELVNSIPDQTNVVEPISPVVSVKENEHVEPVNIINEQPITNQNDVTTQGSSTNEPQVNKKKSGSKLPIIIILLLLIIGGVIGYVLLFKDNGESPSTNKDIKSQEKKSEYRMSGNSLEAFDLYFLKLENEKVNKIYSPLSIKYALEMLAEGADGDSKAQLDAIIGDYKGAKYINSDNMSFANAMFIRNTFKDSIKEEYINNLLNKYGAEVRLDSFESANAINSWVNDTTLNLIPNLVDDDTIKSLDFLLINALAIDMEWEQKFLHNDKGSLGAHYTHQKLKGSDWTYGWYAPLDLVSADFSGMNEKISGMDVIASLNNYDVISDIGEENIRETVGKEYRKFLDEKLADTETYGYTSWIESTFNSDTSEEGINKVVNKYLDEYIKEISENYKKNDYNTDFSVYVDNDVKVFAKDLKEYNGMTLQYIGIMPINEDLDKYIETVNPLEIQNLLGNLKTLKLENFNDGVLTIIKGHIPKFNFEYELDLMTDLKKLGIEDVFDSEKANLSKLTSTNASITEAKHKANIEFTQDGIKASAATGMGGAGSAGDFDYLYEIPYEEIDITFDKPYMFIIRDKNTGEVWFMGTVYNPLLYSEDMTTGQYYNYNY